jgi:hypothetical protein
VRRGDLGRRVRLLCRPSSTAADPSESPDGCRIAYVEESARFSVSERAMTSVPGMCGLSCQTAKVSEISARRRWIRAIGCLQFSHRGNFRGIPDRIFRKQDQHTPRAKVAVQRTRNKPLHPQLQHPTFNLYNPQVYQHNPIFPSPAPNRAHQTCANANTSSPPPVTPQTSPPARRTRSQSVVPPECPSRR